MKFMTVYNSYNHGQATGTGTDQEALLAVNCTAVAQGTTDYERVGRCIFMHYLDLKIEYYRTIGVEGADTWPTAQHTELYVIIDHKRGGGASDPTADEVWEDANYGLLGCQNILAFQNRANEERFEIAKTIRMKEKLAPPWEGTDDTQDAEELSYYTARVPLNLYKSFTDSSGFGTFSADEDIYLWLKFARTDQGDTTTDVSVMSRLAYDDASTVGGSLISTRLQ